MATKTNTTRFPGVVTRESAKRRYNGKPDMVFYYRIKVDGKSVWVKCGWRSEGMTAQLAAQMRSAALLKGRGAVVHVPTLAEVCTWYKAHHLPTLRNSKASLSYMHKHLLPEFGHPPLNEISTAMVTALKNRKLAEGLAPASVKHLLHVLSSIYRQSREAGLHSVENPVASVKPPRVDNQRLRYLTQEEAQRLLSVLESRAPVWHDLAALSLYTGARLSELLTLQAGAVDLPARRAEVSGKTGRRILHLSEAALAILKPRMEGKAGTAFLFPGKVDGHACVTHNVFNAICLELGINTAETPRQQRVVFHTLRHTFASWLAIRGVPLLTISQLMGHSSITMTQRYAHLSPDSRQSAVDMLAQHFTNSGERS